MENDDNFACLSEGLRKTLPSLRIDKWASFATLDLERLVSIPEMTMADMKEISRRLHLLDLPMKVERAKFDVYYLKKRNMTYEQVLQLEFLETPVGDFFAYRPRLLNALKRGNIKTLRDLVSKDIDELLDIPGLGRGTLMEIQGMISARGLRFGAKFPF